MSSTDPNLAGLDQCACKRGFYTLRDCGKQATTTCSLCSRRVCDEHLAPRVDSKVCVECAAKQEEQGTAQPQTAGPVGTAAQGSAFVQPPSAAPAYEYGPPLERMGGYTWGAARWRQRYYSSYDYSPMWWGTYDPYWSAYDPIWYGNGGDDDDDGGFGDS